MIWTSLRAQKILIEFVFSLFFLLIFKLYIYNIIRVLAFLIISFFHSLNISTWTTFMQVGIWRLRSEIRNNAVVIAERYKLTIFLSHPTFRSLNINLFHLNFFKCLYQLCLLDYRTNWCNVYVSFVVFYFTTIYCVEVSSLRLVVILVMKRRHTCIVLPVYCFSKMFLQAGKSFWIYWLTKLNYLSAVYMMIIGYFVILSGFLGTGRQYPRKF